MLIERCPLFRGSLIEKFHNSRYGMESVTGCEWWACGFWLNDSHGTWLCFLFCVSNNLSFILLLFSLSMDSFSKCQQFLIQTPEIAWLIPVIHPLLIPWAPHTLSVSLPLNELMKYPSKSCQVAHLPVFTRIMSFKNLLQIPFTQQPYPCSLCRCDRNSRNNLVNWLTVTRLE